MKHAFLRFGFAVLCGFGLLTGYALLTGYMAIGECRGGVAWIDGDSWFEHRKRVIERDYRCKLKELREFERKHGVSRPFPTKTIVFLVAITALGVTLYLRSKTKQNTHQEFIGKQEAEEIKRIEKLVAGEEI